MPAISPPTTSCRTAVSRCLGLALSALALVALAAPVAGAADAKYEGISADGGVAIFSTTDRLVPGDTDIRSDIYERSIDAGVGDYVTRQVSVGPAGGNNAFDATYYGISQDGSKAFFSTIERLTPDDTDSVLDIYMRDLVARTTVRVSRGDSPCEPSCGNGSDPASPVSGGGISTDGDMVFFSTVERLNLADADSSLDVYARDLTAGSTELVSRGDSLCEPSGCGRGAHSAIFEGASADGAQVLFSTVEGMVDGDTDAAPDIYLRDTDPGSTHLISVAGTLCPSCPPASAEISGSGSHVFFETDDQIDALDTDDAQDVYDWSNGVVALASAGETSCLSGCAHALLEGSSFDGETVYFGTGERLDEVADTDAAHDVYARVGGVTELVSAGEASCQPGCGNNSGFPADLKWVSPLPAGSTVVFITGESLSPLDGDGSQDVYVRDLVAGTTTLASQADSSCVTPDCGEGPFDAQFVGASRDASHIFFTTNESLVPADTDESTDVYDRSGSATTLVSAGQINGNGAFDAQLHGVSQDGLRAFFVTRERLAGDDDFLAESDLYSRASGTTLLVSVGNGQGLVLGPPPPTLRATSPASPNASTTPSILGQAADGSSIKVYVSADCSGAPVATGAATQLASPGIAVSVAVGSTTTFRATAEADGVISDCSGPITYQQQDATPPPPPPPPPPPDSGGGSGGTGGGGSTAPVGGTGGILGPGGIVYVTPLTRITFAPGIKTRNRRPVFRFTDSTGQEGTNFICKVDRQRWRRCGSPKRLKKLKRGKKHVFKVKAVNAVGIWEPKPVKRKFKLVRG